MGRTIISNSALLMLCLALLGSPPALAESAERSSPDATGAPTDPAESAPSDEAPPPTRVAPSPSPPSEPVHPRIVPPFALETLHAPAPAGVLAPGQSATVVLRLDVAADGTISAAEVIESVEPRLDELARSSALRFLFRPASRDGVPTRARILYRYDFEPEPEPEPERRPELPSVTPPARGEAPSPHRAGPTEPAPPAAEGEVQVRGRLSELERLEKSSDAVTLVRLEEARKRSADMGELLARTPGMVVRRTGGLGSNVRISLNGLYGSAVPTFIDGIPLWMSAFSENVSAIPVNMIDHVELYRGVVPLRLSADALGGALDFVTDKSYENHASASLQGGSFETFRGTGLVQYRHEATGFVARLSGYADSARNDYPVDVEVTDARGRLSPATVERFHDRYRAAAVFAEVGVVDRPWARRLLLKGYYGGSYKELQNNLIMSVPYGEASWGDQTGGGTLHYENELSRNVRAELIATLAHRAIHFLDVGEWVYDWYGERVRQRVRPGEIEATAHDQTTWRNAGYARALLEWQLAPAHALTFTTSPLISTQTGDERRQIDPAARDPLTAQRDMQKAVSGVSYRLHAFPFPNAPRAADHRHPEDHRLENVVTLKSYLYHVASEEPLPGGAFRQVDKGLVRFGVSDGVRFAITQHIALKASYEFATRLPEPFETFGDGILTHANLALNPELSHNGNFGPTLDWKNTRTGSWVGMLNGFLRDSDDMIVLLGNDRYYTYQNVYRALTIGLEASLAWTSPHRLLQLDGNTTYVDSRNASDEGIFADFQGDRIPNRPPFSAAWAARLNFEGVFAARGKLQPFYLGRYVTDFFRGWESQGLLQFKQVVPSQLTHDVGVTYSFEGARHRWALTAECQNVTDSRLYDEFGLQRPGRAFYGKLVAELF